MKIESVVMAEQLIANKWLMKISMVNVAMALKAYQWLA